MANKVSTERIGLYQKLLGGFSIPNTLNHQKETLLHHVNPNTGSPYWIKKGKEKNITASSLGKIYSPEDLYDLIKMDESDLRLFAGDGYSSNFKPRNVDISGLYPTPSSGSSGESKIFYHSDKLLNASAVNEYVVIDKYITALSIDLKGTELLSLGPQGGFQREHYNLAYLLDIKYVDLGFDTINIRSALGEEVRRRVSPRIEEASKHLMKGNVGIITMSLDGLLDKRFNELMRRSKIISVSGTSDYDRIQYLKDTFSDSLVIPYFGDASAGAAGGIIDDENRKIVYYFPAPYVVPLVIDKNGRVVGYGEEGRLAFIIAESSMFLAFPTDNVAKRERPNRALFGNIDGVSNIRRESGKS